MIMKMKDTKEVALEMAQTYGKNLTGESLETSRLICGLRICGLHIPVGASAATMIPTAILSWI